MVKCNATQKSLDHGPASVRRSTMQSEIGRSNGVYARLRLAESLSASWKVRVRRDRYVAGRIMAHGEMGMGTMVP
jgi:hypothetical protein